MGHRLLPLLVFLSLASTCRTLDIVDIYDTLNVRDSLNDTILYTTKLRAFPYITNVRVLYSHLYSTRRPSRSGASYAMPKLGLTFRATAKWPSKRWPTG